MLFKPVCTCTFLLLALALAACGIVNTVTPTPLTPPTETLLPPSSTPLPTVTATFTPLPTSTSTATPTPTASPTATPDIKTTQNASKVTYDNVKLRLFLLPGWRVRSNTKDSLSLVTLGSDGKVLASVTILDFGPGVSADILDGNTPKVAAITATLMCDQGIFPFKATFDPDRMVKFANGVQGASAYAVAIPKGLKLEQEFWFINLLTEKQEDILLFVGPVGYYAKNKQVIEDYLATIETTGK